MTDPNLDIQATHKAARQAMARGDLRSAHQHCLQILQQQREHADAWFLCGVIAASNGQQAKAIEIFRNAVMLDPDNPEYLAELGKYLLAQGQLAEALECANCAYAQAPQQTPVLNTLGTLLSHCGEHQQALRCFERVADALQHKEAAADPGWLKDFYFNWSASLQFAGHFDSARTQLERVIALQPDNFRAHFALSSLRQDNGDNNRLAQLEALRDKVKTSRDQLHLGHAMASEQEALGLYAKSIDSLQWAKQQHAAEINYRFEQDARLFRHIRETFNANWFAQGEKGYASPEPIFIVGMPRTGTTLVERILASHTEVFAAGELQNFPLQVKRSAATKSPELLNTDTLARAAELPMRTLGQHYIDSTRPRTGATAHFIDKLPLNFMYIGLIAKALPNAKIICLRRDPMDTCLSNYRQLFATNFPYYRYNYDLLDCGRYYVAFDRLLQHWQQVLPGRVYELQYESLVDEPEKEARLLLQHCQLDWQDACLAFNQSSGSVATPSAVQVRQGIYGSSVQRWRRYGDALGPLHELLQDAGIYH